MRKFGHIAIRCRAESSFPKKAKFSATYKSSHRLSSVTQYANEAAPFMYEIAIHTSQPTTATAVSAASKKALCS